MRLIRTDDAKLIARLNEPVQDLHYELYPNNFKPFELTSVYEYFSKIINKDNHHFIVCFNDEEAVGYIWYEDIQKHETAFSYSLRYIYIHQISVNPDFRGKGVGKLLFNEALKFAKEKSINRIGLDYWVKNAAAKRVYKKLGFELEKEITYLNV